MLTILRRTMPSPRSIAVHDDWPELWRSQIQDDDEEEDGPRAEPNRPHGDEGRVRIPNPRLAVRRPIEDEIEDRGEHVDQDEIGLVDSHAVLRSPRKAAVSCRGAMKMPETSTRTMGVRTSVSKPRMSVDEPGSNPLRST